MADDITRTGTDASLYRPRSRAGHSQARHLMRFFPGDWLGSPLRAELILERAHAVRLAYLELLFVLHDKGGRLLRSDLSGAVGMVREEAEAAISRLLESGRIIEQDGYLINPRVLSQIEDDERFMASCREAGRVGGLASAKARSTDRRGRVKGRSTSSQPASAVASAVASAPASASAPAGGTGELSLSCTSDEQQTGSRIADRIIRILNAVGRRRLGRNRALEEAVVKALRAGYPEDEILGALWGGLCGPVEWWRSEQGGNCDPMLLLRFRGGVNPTTGQPARQWLPELLATLPEAAPQYVRNAMEALVKHGLEVEVEWLRTRKIRGTA